MNSATTITLDEAIAKIPYGKESFDFVTWGAYGIAVVTCIGCCLISARAFAHEDYERGQLALLGAAIAGAAPQLAKLFALLKDQV